MNTRQMNYTIDSLIRFITVVAFSVLGMFAYFFSIYLKLAIESGIDTALQDGLLVVVIVSAYWIGGSLFSRPKPPALQTWLKGIRFGIVAIFGLVIFAIAGNYLPKDGHTYTVTTTDPDLPYGDILTLTTPTLPAWLTLTDHGAGTAALSGTPINAGEYTIVLRITDSAGAFAEQNFVVTVTEKPHYYVYIPLVLRGGP